MKITTKIVIILGGLLLVSALDKSSDISNIGSYNINNGLANIWIKRLCYTSIPGLGLADAIIKSAKSLYTDNNMKGVNRYVH